MKTRTLLLATIFSLAAVGTALAIGPTDHAAHHGDMPATANASSPTVMPMQGAMMAPIQRAQMHAQMLAMMRQDASTHMQMMQAMHQAFQARQSAEPAGRDVAPAQPQ